MSRVPAGDNEAELRDRQLHGETPPPRAARQEARVGPDAQARREDAPAPGEANPTSEPEGRPLDRREREP